MLSEANKYCYQFMRLDKISRILNEFPVVIQPTGLLEWHGDHNAIGTDGLLSTHISERTIIKLGNGILMPTNWIGTYGYIRYPGSIVYDEKTVEQIFSQMFQEFIKIGFRVIVILTGHFGPIQEKALKNATESAQKIIIKQKKKVKILGVKWPDFIGKLSYGHHAQWGETSMLLRVGQEYNMDLVNLDSFQLGIEDPPRYELINSKTTEREPKIWKWTDNLKDATVCNAEKGEELIKTAVDNLTSKILQLMKEK